MRHLITGANGFLGANLARKLRERGDDVRCLVRAGSDDSALAGLDCERATGDVTDAQSLPPALKNVDVVIHLAGIRRASARSDFMRVNADGTRIVCDAMLRAGTRRLVLCSSLAASGPCHHDRPRVESDPFCPEEWYGESKAEAERIAFGYAKELEVTCVRPSRVVGPKDRENLPFFRIAKKGIVLKLGGPERRLSMVDVEDIVDLTVLLADKREAVGEAFFGTGPDTTTLDGLMTLAAEALGVKARTVLIPQPLLKLMGTGADVVSQLSGKKLPLNRKLARQLLAPGWTCSIEKARRVLGYAPKFSLTDSARRSADGYLRDGWL